MKYKKLTPQERQEIIKKHFEKRISQTKLAEDYNTNRTTINVLCRNVKKSPLIRRKIVLNDREIIEMYTIDKKSVVQIARKLKTKTINIRKILNKNKIPKKISQRAKWEKEIPHYHLKYRIWVARVIERDNLKCKWCGAENSFKNRLEANHIVPMRDITNIKMVFDVNNGITLCKKCHLKIHYHEKEFEQFFLNLIQTKSSE